MGLNALLKKQLGHGPKFHKLHIHSLFIPVRRNWTYFRCMGSGFQDNGWFSKLPYLTMKLGHWPKFRKWRIYSLSNPGARNWDYSHSMGSGFRDTGRFSKVSYLGMNSRTCTYSLFLPQGVEIELIFTLGSYGQRFLRYRLICKIAIFGHLPSFMPKYGTFENWPVSSKLLPVEQNKLNFNPLG